MKKTKSRQEIVFGVCDELHTRGTDPTYTNVLPILQRRGQGMSARDLQPILTTYSARQKVGAKVRRITHSMLLLTKRERRAVLRAVKVGAA